jgi:phosphoglucomutase/phosphomannomutase
MTVASNLERARNGFASIPLSQEQKDAALVHLEDWLTAEHHAAYRPQLESLIAQEKWSLLLDSFYQVIPFGTGGRRGAVGIGPNRINPHSITTSVQGFVQYLHKRFPEQKQFKVVIACDVRQFLDIRGNYDASLPNPILNLGSTDFVQMAACVFAAHGVKVLMLPPDSGSYVSTPELSFLIRHTKADGGLNISASHNHPDDNGGKFYHADGGQPIPPYDEQMSAIVESVRVADTMPFEEAVAQGWIEWIGPELRKEYIHLITSLKQWDGEKGAKIVYTPLSGTGSTSVGESLKSAGFDLHYYEPQQAFDGSFENVRFRAPNPEIPGVMNEAVEYARSIDADIVLGTDPDADRIGLVTTNSRGGWTFVNGNEIASLLTLYLLRARHKKNPENKGVVVKTEVTTDLISRIAEQYNAHCVGNLLVGFKYIGELLGQLEDNGRFKELTASVDDFVLGVEESHGALVTAEMRDKDAAGAAFHLAELACELKAEGRTIDDELTQLYKTHGMYSNSLFSMVMEGAIGLSRISQLLEELRQNPMTSLNGVAVSEFFDHQNENGRFGAFRSTTDRKGRNVLVFHLEDGSRLILRPSGTEPKAKLYVEVHGEPTDSDEVLAIQRRELKERARGYSVAFLQEALGRIGISVPEYALNLSDLVSIDNKERFGSTLFPAFLEEAAQAVNNGADTDALKELLLSKLDGFGSNPDALVAPALANYVRNADVRAQTEDALFSALESLSASLQG